VYKTYPQLPHISLTRPQIEDAGLFKTISRRQSARHFLQEPMTVQQLSQLLLYSCGTHQGGARPENDGGLDQSQHRAQPSGGGRFPIEAYILNFVEGEIPAGVFHYNIRDHALDVLEKRTFSAEEIRELFIYPYVQRASCAIVLTAVFERNQIKYGERGYRYILFEAGHIGQNISLVSQALKLGSVMMGGSVDGVIEKLLDIDGITESLVYTAIVGA
jgi:SagB-type dehydrogenase family enzyme